MCGFVGIIGPRGPNTAGERATLAAMTAALLHRGPDDTGHYESDHALLGHRRLAVIDVVGSTQPALFGELVMVYNGEIYNFLEVRQELEALGHVFTQHGDTEVLLHAYAEWGAACLDRLNGDFAFAILNTATRELFAARDRLGVKPLYYTQVGQILLIASEMKALLVHAGVRKVLDVEAVLEGLTYGQVLAPKTLVQGVCMLEAGHHLHFADGQLQTGRYWDLAYRPHGDSFEQACTTVADLLADAVRLRMISDVPVCGLLSGGLDSSVLCTLMAKQAAGPLDAFSVDFKSNQYEQEAEGSHVHQSDVAFARSVTEHIGARHHVEVIEPSALQPLLLDAARARDLPVVLGSEAAMSRLFERVKPNATVAISGDGADEVFLGYYMMVNEAAMVEAPGPFFVCPADKFFHILHPALRSGCDPTAYVTRRFDALLADAPELGEGRARHLHLMHYLQIKVVLPYLLDRVDRISMSKSVEVRVPYCDHRLAEYVFNLAPEIKFRSGAEKGLLRQAFRGQVLDAVLERKKSVFPYPFDKTTLDGLFDKTLALLAASPPDSLLAAVFDLPTLGASLRMAQQGLLDTFSAHSLCTHVFTLHDLFQQDGWEMPELLKKETSLDEWHGPVGSALERGAP